MDLMSINQAEIIAGFARSYGLGAMVAWTGLNIPSVAPAAQESYDN